MLSTMIFFVKTAVHISCPEANNKAVIVSEEVPVGSPIEENGNNRRHDDGNEGDDDAGHNCSANRRQHLLFDKYPTVSPIAIDTRANGKIVG